jgi:hypothetical protein
MIYIYIMPCNTLKDSWRFGGTHRLNFQAQRISQARNQQEAGSWFMLISCLSHFSTLKMETFPPKRRSSSNGVHSVISQNMKLFTDEFFAWIFAHASILLWCHLYENRHGCTVFVRNPNTKCRRNPSNSSWVQTWGTNWTTDTIYPICVSCAHHAKKKQQHNTASSNTEKVSLFIKLIS